MLKKTFISFLFVITTFAVFSQNAVIDSLQEVVKNTTSDSIKAEAMVRLGTEFYYYNTDTSIIILKKALDLVPDNQNLQLVSDCYNNIAICYDVQGDKKEANIYYNKVLELQTELKDTASITAALINMSVTQADIGENIDAVNSLERAYKLSKQSNDTVTMGITILNICIILLDLEQIEKAQKYVKEALDLSKLTNDYETESVALTILGEINIKKENYSEALKYLEEAMSVAKKTGLPILSADILSNIAEVHILTQNELLAKNYVLESLTLRRNVKDVIGISDNQIQLAKIYLSENNIEKSKQYADSSLNIALENNLLLEKKESSELLYELHKKQKNWQKALQMHEILMQAKDSLFNDKTKNAITEHLYKFQYEKKHYTDSIEEKTKLKIISNNQKSKTVERNIVAVAFVISILFLIIIIMIAIKQKKANKLLDEKNNQLKQANERLDNSMNQQNVLNQKLFGQSLQIDQKNIEIEENEHKIKKQFEDLQIVEQELRQNHDELQNVLEDLEYQKKELQKTNNTLSFTNLKLDASNKEILAGINYASTIQESMLTSKDIINTYLSEYFLIYKPKDIVSGDFYYITKIKNNLIIAVADCTGHGVSGAFITMLGITYLHDAITRREIKYPNTVLEKVRERFKRTFEAFGSESLNGMDIALCVLNSDTLVMQYSGANIPLWIVRNGNLIENKPTRCPIGFYPIEVEFVQNEIQMEKNDTVFMFSDGIHDQLNEKKLRKYQKNKFRTLILENSELSMEMQEQKIINDFENWKGKNKQTDDITVLGFKI